MSATPERIEALERRVAALEAKSLPAPKVIAKGRECPGCGAELMLKSEKPDPVLGKAGVKVHALVCPNCKLETNRQFAPGKGYL